MPDLTPRDLVYIERCKSADYALDALLDYTDRMMWAGAWDKIDEFFRAIKPAEHSIVILIGCLSATHMGRQDLKDRGFKGRDILIDLTAERLKELGREKDVENLVERFR